MHEPLAANISWERMARAVDAVRERTLRAAATLETAAIDYAVVGGNAVAAWVSSVDEAAVRNTRDVDIMLRRSDFDAAKAAFVAAGFVFRHSSSIDMFLDGEGAKARDAVHILYANERVRAEQPEPNPDVLQSDRSHAGFRVLRLEPLVAMKLNAYRRKDQVHLLDFISLGMIDATWPARFSPVLASRLQQLLDDPDG